MQTQTLFKIALTLALTFVLTSSKIDTNTASENSASKFSSIVVDEETLEIEPWMVNDSFWNLSNDSEVVNASVQPDTAMAIEQWMTDDKLWKI